MVIMTSHGAKFAIALLGLAVVVPAYSAAGAATPGRVALIVGDSLTQETAPVFAAPAGWRYEFDAVRGTAPCQWLRDGRLIPLLRRRPALLVLETAVNVNHCADLGGSALLSNYTRSLSSIFALAARMHTRVLYVVAPPLAAPALAARERAVGYLARWASRQHVGVTAAPRIAVSARGHFTMTLPCLATETHAMGCTSGHILIREDAMDHVHFCPYIADVRLPRFTCSVYSSGEHRWASAIDSLVGAA